MTSDATTSDRARRQALAAQRIALAVKQRRKRLGVTQQTLAQMAGCGLVFVYNIEHGKPSLRLDKLLDVLDVLGLELVVTASSSGLRVVAAPP
jgi:HTH-type transcriptional regulator / antitoxin HipB